MPLVALIASFIASGCSVGLANEEPRLNDESRIGARAFYRGFNPFELPDSLEFSVYLLDMGESAVVS